MPFGQLPVLFQEENGKLMLTLAQSHAIERYLAKVLGLAGQDIQETAYLDSVFESFLDFEADLKKVAIAKENEKVTARTVIWMYLHKLSLTPWSDSIL